MKPKNFILLFILGLFIYLLPSVAEAACPIGCVRYVPNGSEELCSPASGCEWGKPYAITCSGPTGGTERLGIIGSINQVVDMPVDTYPVFVESCSIGSSKCKLDAFPSGSNGQNCTARDRCANPVCSECAKSGKWDASESKCVSCNGKKEELIRGDTSEVYAGCAGVISSCSDEGNTGDGQCESACGANAACDEVTDGNPCAVGKYCEALGRNCQSGDYCSGCVCLSDSYTLTVTKAGTGSGTVSSSPAGITCGATCSSQSASFSKGTSITLTAAAASDSTFAGWSGDCTGTGSTCNLTMNANKSVTATFNLKLPNLKISDIEDFDTDKKVYYTIHNQGNATTGAGFNCSLYVGGTYKAYQYFSSALGAGLYRDGVFSGWTCTPGQTYSIKVCADDKNGASLIAESNENDNCRTESLTCPSECTGSINVTPESDTEPCDFTISIYNVDYCQGLTWQVTRDGSSIGSGTVTGDTNWDRTLYDNGLGADSSINYRLYIDGNLKDSDSVSCQEAGCDCSSWVNQSCGYSDCDSYHLARTRTCPNDCDIELECLCDESCCSAWSNQGCGPTGGCTETEMSQTRNCGDCPYSESQCISDPSCGAAGINPPQVTTHEATNITQTSAALNGNLLSLGYDPGTCPDCQCIVWLEWGTSGTAGASGSYGNSTTPKPMTAASSFTEVISGLSPGITYYFEAFAKNGGSW